MTRRNPSSTLLSRSSITSRFSINNMGFKLLIIFLTINNVILVNGFEYDNEIQGEPTIECEHDSIKFIVDTMKSPPSTIYIKGNMDKEECVFKDAKNATIPLNKCNMRRKREINPSGIDYSFTVVVQLHPLFITKVDRAYNVRCFYQESQKKMTVDFEVSDLTTISITETPPLPNCVYTVRKGSLHGPLVRHVMVGDSLFHVWECPTELYSMLLHSCVADDGSGNKYEVINDKGCAVDEYLMPQVSYNDELTMANVEINAFTFADKTSLSFMCQIQLCFKNEDCSQITPPRCGANANIDNEIETTTESISENQNTLTDELTNEELILSSSSTVSSTQTTIESITTIAESIVKHPKNIEMPDDFPRPNVLPNDDSVEGSGEDHDPTDFISTTTTAGTTAALKILEKQGKTKPSKRPQRHSGPKPRSLINMDIQSPELTIMEKYLEPEMQQGSPKSLISNVNEADNYSIKSGNILNERVCIPATGFYGSILFIILFGSIILVLLIKSRKQLVHKFY